MSYRPDSVYLTSAQVCALARLVGDAGAVSVRVTSGGLVQINPYASAALYACSIAEDGVIESSEEESCKR